jgi:2'-5' RNA ligase
MIPAMNSDEMPEGVQLRDFDDHAALRQNIFDGTKEEISKAFPQAYGGVRMELHDVNYVDPEHYDLKAQKEHLLQDKFLHRRLRGTLSLHDDKTGEKLDERTMTLLRVPYLTDRGTFIHGGSEYTSLMQSRLLPGAYTRRQNNGGLETQFNVRTGTGTAFRTGLEPETSQFRLRVQQANLHLYSLMHDLGVPDEHLAKMWGQEVLVANQKKYDARVFDKAYQRFVPKREQKPDDDREAKVKQLKTAFDAAMIHGGVVAKTLPNMLDMTKAAHWQKRYQRRQIADTMSKRAYRDVPFEPDFTPDQLTEQNNARHGVGPRLAGTEWPSHWLPEQDAHWIEWYEQYHHGRRTKDDDHQIMRWKRFKTNHGKHFVANPTTRQAFALKNWGIDAVKMLPEEQREAFQSKMDAYRDERIHAHEESKQAATLPVIDHRMDKRAATFPDLATFLSGVGVGYEKSAMMGAVPELIGAAGSGASIATASPGRNIADTAVNLAGGAAGVADLVDKGLKYIPQVGQTVAKYMPAAAETIGNATERLPLVGAGVNVYQAARLAQQPQQIMDATEAASNQHGLGMNIVNGMGNPVATAATALRAGARALTPDTEVQTAAPIRQSPGDQAPRFETAPGWDPNDPNYPGAPAPNAPIKEPMSTAFMPEGEAVRAPAPVTHASPVASAPSPVVKPPVATATTPAPKPMPKAASAKALIDDEKKNREVLEDLIKAKEHSDNKRFGEKSVILHRLMHAYPDDFVIDDDWRYAGITHIPSGFRIHAPRNIVPAQVAVNPLSKVYQRANANSHQFTQLDLNEDTLDDMIKDASGADTIYTNHADAWHPGDKKFHLVDVDKLIAATRGRPVQEVPIDHIWGGETTSPGFSEDRVRDTDIQHPILVDSYYEGEGKKYGLVDGRHRKIKRLRQGLTHAPIIQITPQDIEASAVGSTKEARSTYETRGTVAVDLDGTLAWRPAKISGIPFIGKPIPAMAKRVRAWIAEGRKVVIFTARASNPKAIPPVKRWLEEHGFPPLEVTNEKTSDISEIWDDRAIGVEFNTGEKKADHCCEVCKECGGNMSCLCGRDKKNFVYAGPCSMCMEKHNKEAMTKEAGEAGCLMIRLGEHDARKIIEFENEHIPEDQLAGDGYERDVHVTIAYGFTPDFDPQALWDNVFQNRKALHVKLGPIKRFKASDHRPDSDVLVVEVDSPELEELHYELRKRYPASLNVTFPKYSPHLTLAYVRPDACKDLDGHDFFKGHAYLLAELNYSRPGRGKKETYVIGQD